MKFLLIWHETLILTVFITCCILNYLQQSFYLLMSTYILFKHRVRFQKHHFAKVWFLKMIFLVIWKIRIKSTINSVCSVRNIKRRVYGSSASVIYKFLIFCHWKCPWNNVVIYLPYSNRRIIMYFNDLFSSNEDLKCLEMTKCHFFYLQQYSMEQLLS